MTTEKITGNKTLLYDINSVQYACPAEVSTIKLSSRQNLLLTFGTGISTANAFVHGNSVGGTITLTVIAPGAINSSILKFTLPKALQTSNLACLHITPANAITANLESTSSCTFLTQNSKTELDLISGSVAIPASSPLSYKWNYFILDSPPLS